MASKQETVRLRNVNSGAVVSVVAEKASRMGAEWEPADGPTRRPAAATKTAAPRKRTKARKAATKKASAPPPSAPSPPASDTPS